MESGKLSDELKEKLDKMVQEFKDMFQIKENTIVDLDSKESDTEAEEAEVK
jgi:F-type H+-transporting ATPase subunit alpha